MPRTQSDGWVVQAAKARSIPALTAAARPTGLAAAACTAWGAGATGDAMRALIANPADAAAAALLWATRSGRTQLNSKWWFPATLLALFGPLLANSLGWIFTEMGRQPWVVFGLMNTEDGVSPGVGATEVLISMLVFTLLYGALALVEVKLMVKYASAGAEHVDAEKAQRLTADDEPHVFAY